MNPREFGIGLFLIVCILHGCAGTSIEKQFERANLIEGNSSGKIEYWTTVDKDGSDILVLSYDSPEKLANTMRVYHKGQVVTHCNDNELKEVDQREGRYGETFKLSWKNDVDCRVLNIYDTLDLEILDSNKVISKYRYISDK